MLPPMNRNATRNGFRGGRDAAAAQENMELLTGQRGNGLDRAITVRELANLGLIGVSRSGNGVMIPRPVPPTGGDGNDDIVVEMPHAPVGFAGFGGFGAIMLEWRNPTFQGYAYTEIWRSTDSVLANAVLIATTPATVFSDIVSPGSAFYYWARFVNLADVAGPYNDVEGTLVKTSADIGGIIDDIGAQMAESELIQGLQQGISDGDKAAQEAIDAAKDELIAANEALQGSIDSAKDQLEAADSALADVIANVEAGYIEGDKAAHAAIKELETAVEVENGVLAQRIEQITADYKGADAATNAAITSLAKTVATEDQALAERIDGLSAEWESSDENVLAQANANITEASKVLAEKDKVLAEQVSTIEAEYKAADKEIKGAISELSQVVATDDNILAQQISQMDAAFKVAGESATQTTNAKITQAQKVLTDADSALAQIIQELDAAYKEADNATGELIKEVQANIISMDKVLTDADKALAESVSSLEAAYKSGDNKLDGRITSLSKTVADADKVISDKVDTVQSSINGVSATVQQNSQAISKINEDGSTAHKSMWGTKVQAGDIKAGIGILADSDGTSQVAVSASQFFVFDPNKSGTIQPLFAIDKGNVIIPKALIESATIQILQAQTIVADEVKAGISISSPKVNGGEITGSVVRIGSGGPFGGYRTAIWANGHIQTNWLEATSGKFSGEIQANKGTLNNVVINENCTVKGKVQASQIVGDVMSQAFLRTSVVKNKYFSNGSFGWFDVWRFTIHDSAVRERYITLSGFALNFSYHSSGEYTEVAYQLVGYNGHIFSQALERYSQGYAWHNVRIVIPKGFRGDIFLKVRGMVHDYQNGDWSFYPVGGEHSNELQATLWMESTSMSGAPVLRESGDSPTILPELPQN